ncbi:MAG: aminotransferase class I/II-fold pyridoxal phosphate-dependent enzyme [Thermodesulfovibrionales bacterium]|nr:aminotransferase class I/II-fold pyridoxal phosphate-dependent enzyme [Thermodesulfovibrionales bacterium]
MQNKYKIAQGNADVIDAYSLAEQLGIDEDEILDFSSTSNPLSTPKSVINAIKDNIPYISRYPDTEARFLKKELSRHYDIPQSSIICGNGSNEIIHLIIQALQPERLLLLAPTYQEYERAFNIHVKRFNLNASVEYINLTEESDFAVSSKEIISSITGGKDVETLKKSPTLSTPDMVILCNPNNPTGSLLGREELLEIAKVTRALKIHLVIDEAYIDFCHQHSLINDVIENPYLLVIRSFSSFYGLTGLRLGFAVVNPSLIDRVKRLQQPMSVNTLAQICGVSVINDKNFISQTIRLISEEKTTLEDGFRAIKIRYFPSACNFYLIKIDNAQEVLESLKQKAIILRGCSDFKGLDNSFLRVTVRSYKENMKLLKELAKLLI